MTQDNVIGIRGDKTSPTPIRNNEATKAANYLREMADSLEKCETHTFVISSIGQKNNIKHYRHATTTEDMYMVNLCIDMAKHQLLCDIKRRDHDTRQRMGRAR